jgi:aminomethyltransferase
LHDEHVALGAKLVEFGGWEMPLAYPLGTIAEHLSCRSGAVAFDVSHLGTVRLTGEDAYERLQETFTNDLAKIEPGRAQYTHLCDERGSVVDDLIVWWVDGDRFDVMPNASNTAGVRSAVGGTDVTAERAVLAVQGPEARSRLAVVSEEAASVGRFRVARVVWETVPMVVAGTGYTGEDGVEIAVPASDAPALWRALLAAGIEPAGLGARDTLRLEAALPLHGHELGPGITPLQAGLAWVVAWSKPKFRGKAALEAERAAGPARLLGGLSIEGRRPARAGCPVSINSDVVGEVTSGNFSPTLGHGIALAMLPPGTPLATPVEVEVRGSRVDAEVVATPFVKKELRRTPRPAGTST